MDLRVDSSASQADDWLPRIHKVVSLADTSVAEQHGHDYWNDHAKVFDDVGNDVGNEAGWIEDGEEANSDGWIDGDNLNGATKHPDSVGPLPGALPSTSMSDARSGIGVEPTVNDRLGNQVTIKREPEDFDHQCAQSFDAFPHDDTSAEERDIAIKQETADDEYYPDPYLCSSSRANVIPEEINNAITTGLGSVPHGTMQEQSQCIQQQVLDPTIKLEPTFSESIEQFGQTSGIFHPVKCEPDEPMVSHFTEEPYLPGRSDDRCDKHPQPSGTKIRVNTRHECAGSIQVLKDKKKKKAVTSPMQSQTEEVPSTCEPQRAPEGRSQIAKYSSIDDYVDWLADYISKGNKSNIVLKGPTKLISDVTRKVNEKMELAKKAQSLAKQSSGNYGQHPEGSLSSNSCILSTYTATSMKWTSGGLANQPNNLALHFSDINQRPLLPTEDSNPTPNKSFATNALPNYSVLGLTNTARSVPIVFTGDMTPLEPPKSPHKYRCSMSKTKRVVRLSPPRRSERERKAPLPFTARAPDTTLIAPRRSGRERKVPRPYSPPPIKTKRIPYAPAKPPVAVKKTETSAFSNASVASGSRMSDMIRRQGGISLLPPQYRIISGACTEMIQPSDGVDTLGGIRSTILPLDDIDDSKAETIVEPSINVPHDDMDDKDIKPPLMLTVDARGNIADEELSDEELSQSGSAYTTAPVNDRNVGGNLDTDITFQNDHDYEDVKPPLPLGDVGCRPRTETQQLLPSPHHHRADGLLLMNEVENPHTKMSVEPNRTAVPDIPDGTQPLMLSGSAPRSGTTVREMLQSSRLSSANQMSPAHFHYDNDVDIIPPTSLSADARQNMTVRELIRHKKRCELQERLQEQEKALEDLRRKRMEQIERRKTDPDLSDLY